MSAVQACSLHWLERHDDWDQRLKALPGLPDRAARWAELIALADSRIDTIQTNRLDRALRAHFADRPPEKTAGRPIRLAILASSTVTHLLPGLRVGALRRGLWLQTFVADYNQYVQVLLDPPPALTAFAPTEVLFAFDAPHMTLGLDPLADGEAVAALREEKLAQLEQVWRLCRDRFAGPILQQAILPTFDPLLGGNEHRLPGSPQRFVAALNEAMRDAAARADVDILSIDERCARQGLEAWYEPMLWLKAKQEVAPGAAPLYGDLAARILAARQGRSFKAMVLDLDNTLWGGVIGDDGLNGIVVGQGSATGESFLALQAYAKEMSRRGIILAVCSKNDSANALLPFKEHPDMLLREGDFSAFVANWDDKALNIRRIAAELNIGLDSLVFVDDNPFERNLVRAELPMVAVPEVPEEPALVARCVADAGYFESLGLTADDRQRAAQYQTNAARAAFAAEASDLEGYLRGLDMRLMWRRFDADGLARIVQLINKTNQFNLTTRRYTEQEVTTVMTAADAFGLQFRLIDRFGDNGMIAVVIGRLDGPDLDLDTWLMSCRVLGRQVEAATLAVVAQEARALGARSLVGRYKPTAKNAMVRGPFRQAGLRAPKRRRAGQYGLGPRLGRIQSEAGRDGHRRRMTMPGFWRLLAVTE